MGSFISTPECSPSLCRGLLELAACGEAAVLEEAHGGMECGRQGMLLTEANTRASLCGDSASSPNHQARIREPRGASPSAL